MYFKCVVVWCRETQCFQKTFEVTTSLTDKFLGQILAKHGLKGQRDFAPLDAVPVAHGVNQHILIGAWMNKMSWGIRLFIDDIEYNQLFKYFIKEMKNNCICGC